MLKIPPQVLIVEDNPYQAILLRTCVEQMGLKAIGPVATAADALVLCAHTLPNLAILDVALAGPVDGIDLARQLTQLGQIPLIFASATENLKVMAQIWETRPVAFLPKPYHLTSLQRVIELALYGHMRTPVPILLEEATEPALAEEIADVVLLNSSWLFVRERHLLVRVDAKDILCVQMERRYCLITLVSGKRHSVRTALVPMLQYLGNAEFTQVHRSWLVQMRHIESVDPTAGIIRMPNALEVPLGRVHRDNLLERLRLLD